MPKPGGDDVDRDCSFVDGVEDTPVDESTPAAPIPAADDTGPTDERERRASVEDVVAEPEPEPDVDPEPVDQNEESVSP